MATIIEAADNDALRDVRQQYFGTRVTPRAFEQWLDDISRVLDSPRRRWLSGHHNLHSLYRLHHSHEIRRFYERCDDCYVDGTPVRLLLGAFGIRTSAEQRFSLMDHFLELLQRAEQRRWSIYYLGSSESVINVGRTFLAKRFPELRIQLHHGYSPNSEEVLSAINTWRPDILLVGMGMPLQERWLLEHFEHLDVGFATPVGATLDYYTGAQARPPRGFSKMGFAWAYRLAHDPARLWRRYLLEPWGLLRPTLQHWRKFRRLRQVQGE